jgi:hypothetical protein
MKWWRTALLLAVVLVAAGVGIFLLGIYVHYGELR